MSRFTLVSSVFESVDSPDIIHKKLDALLDTKAHIVLYASSECYSLLYEKCNNTPNILLMPPIRKESLWVYGFYKKYGSHLPTQRNMEKDTELYMLYRHAKHEFIEHTVRLNPWKSTHFIWTDFDILNRCDKLDHIRNYFRWLSACEWKSPFLTMTGGWDPLQNEAHVLESPYWRFCGVFMGDSSSILEFCELYKVYLPLFLEKHGKWVWEFNVWAWMEWSIGRDAKWKAIWYREPNDINEIFMFSSDYYTSPVKYFAIEKKDYLDHNIEGYHGGSASYLCYQGESYLNIRFVNYWITPYGYYIFQEEVDRRIQSKNVLIHLNHNTLAPTQYREILEDIRDLNEKPVSPLSVGLEDIRLFEYNKKPHYIATTMGYTSDGKARIIMGEYDIQNACILSGKIIQPPLYTHCEKNWVPIIRYGDDGPNNDNLFFIYKWHPMQLGKITDNFLEIVEEWETPSLIFRKVRGSSCFIDTTVSDRLGIDTPRGFLGVVHYSEEHSPRHYYHMLVLLDKKTLRVVQHSTPFCFEKLGIEFCIGFAIHPITANYVFWISRHDRDPCEIHISPSVFVFTNIA